jgi:hypothetical protein
MTTTARLGVTHVDLTDTGPGLRTKANAAFDAFDKSVGRVLCTSASRPTTGLFAGMQAYETDTKRTIVSPRGVLGEWYVENQEPIGAGMVRAMRPMRNFGEDANHSAFPSAVTLLDGTIMVVWRQGTDHAATRDGIIRKSYTTDQGRTWSGTATVASGSPAGTDLRDPCVSLSMDGTTIYLSYFKGTAALAAAGVFFRSSIDNGATWSAEVRVDNALPYAASSAPVVQLNNGTLVMTYYGRSGAETRDSVWTSKSTDGGVTWGTHTRIRNGTTDTQDYQEPYIAMRGTIGLMAYRVGTAGSIGVSSTSDNTANWSGVTTTFVGTGRPTVINVNPVRWAILYRRLSGGDAVMRSSQVANGSSWWPERLVDPARSAAGWMTYAGGDKVGPNAYFCVMAQETSTTSSKLCTTYIGEAGARTPFGNIPSNAEAAASDYDLMIFQDVFEMGNGTLPDPWTLAAGAITVEEGYMRSASADNVPDFPRIFVNTSEVDIEADITNEVGFQSGAAIVFRMINANSYMMFTIEGSGVNFRVYKVVSGVATQLATVNPTPQMIFNSYNTYRVVARGQGIWTYINGQLIHNFLMAGGDYTTFAAGGYVGVKLNSQGTSIHKCRRFQVRA